MPRYRRSRRLRRRPIRGRRTYRRRSSYGRRRNRRMGRKLIGDRY